MGDRKLVDGKWAKELDEPVNLVIKTKIPNAGLLFVSNRMIKPENINHLKKFISTSKMTWVVCLSEIFTEFSKMNPENHIEILNITIFCIWSVCFDKIG